MRFGAAALAAAAGCGVYAALAALPAGLGAGEPLTLALLVLSSAWFWGAFGGALAATTLWWRPWQRASAGALPMSTRQTIAEPLLWGCAAPLASLVLDPWWFHRTVTVIGFAGLALGILGLLARLRAADIAPPCPRQLAPAAIAVAAVLVPLLLVLPGPPWFHPFSGDEPHYLVTARSLWVDGDVDVANEYRDRLTQPFWTGELSPHAKPGINPATRYSIHGTGLPLFLAPWYGAGHELSATGFHVLIRTVMSLWLAAAALAIFYLLRDLAGASVALPGTVAAIFTLPLLFAGPHLFPGVPVLALSCGAYTLVRRASSPAAAFAAGLMLAYLPWLHFKFFGVVVTIAALGLWFLWRRADAAGFTAGAAALLAPPALSGIAHAFFTWTLYERLSPLAIHIGADPTLRSTARGDDWYAYFTDLGGALRTGIGYFLDQREGLLFYAPHYLLAVAGLAWLLRHRRRDAVALLLVLGSLVGPYALSQEIGHWAPPARPLTGVLWVLAVAMGVGLALPAGAGAGGRRRAALRAVLVCCGVCSTVLLLLQANLLYHDYNVPRSLLLLHYGAPGLPLADLAPLWLGPQAVLWAISLAGLAVVIGMGAVMWRWGSSVTLPKTPASALPGATAIGAAAAVILVATAAMLAHHFRVPVSDLHVSWSYDRVSMWKPATPPTRAWGEPEGLWTGGTDDVRLLLSSADALDLIVLEATVLTPMWAEVQLGRDRQRIDLVPGQRSLLRLRPGSGRSWQGATFYHFNVVASRSISPAALGLGHDTRGLGVMIRVVQAN